MLLQVENSTVQPLFWPVSKMINNVLVQKRSSSQITSTYTSFCIEPNCSDGLYCIGVESSIATHLQWPVCEGGGGCGGGMVLPSKKEYMRDFMRVFFRNYLKKAYAI